MQAIRWSRDSWSGRRLAALAAAALGMSAAGAATLEPDLAARLARDQGTQRYPVILRLAQQPDANEMAQRVAAVPQGQRGGRLLEALKAFNAPLQAPLVLDLQSRHAEQVVPLVTLNAIAAHLPAKDIRELAKRSDIASIRYDIGLLAPSRRPVADPCKPARPTPRQRLPKSCRGEGRAPAAVQAAGFDAQLPASPALRAIGAPAAWQAGYTGKGVTVAVVDTGVDASHPDLAGSFRGGAADWFDVHGEHDRPMDRHGHGTQIAGLVSGAGASGQTLGVAPQSRWIAARIYSDRNIGRLSQLPGLSPRPQALSTTCGASGVAGMHVVFAAGNGGPMENSSLSPANNAGALAVGALDGEGQMAMFSSRGVSACDARPYPDVMAPGELLRTTDLAAGSMPITTLATGTSYAAALVSGELALLLQARPDMPMAEREALLRAVPGETRPPLLRALGLAARTAP